MASLKNGMHKTTIMRESGSLQAKTSAIKAVFASNDKDNDSVSVGDSNDNQEKNDNDSLSDDDSLSNVGLHLLLSTHGLKRRMLQKLLRQAGRSKKWT